jgi:hypothetical protein
MNGQNWLPKVLQAKVVYIAVLHWRQEDGREHATWSSLQAVATTAHTFKQRQVG